jgi:hypothetical protein
MDDGTGHQAGLLELKGCGGTVVGFNVDPRRPCIVEVDGYQIPKSLGPALAQMMKGDLGGIEVPPSMAQDYRVFVSAVSRNATGLVQTPPRPITTRPRIRPR